jgi:hypothetical protein
MKLRTAAIAAALVVAAACRTSGSQASGGQPSPTSTEATTAGTQTAPSGTAGQDPLMRPGPDLKGHASDQVISGAIARISSNQVAIASDGGSLVVLEIVPETSITVNGQDASYDQLQEGQPVRASFSEVQGEGHVAVEIRALPAQGGGSYGSSGSSGYGSPDTGSTGSGGDTGSSSGSGSRW